MVARTMLCGVLLSMALIFNSAPSFSHEIRPTIADVAVTQSDVTLSLRINIEPLVAGIDLSLIDNTNNAPEAAMYDQFRAMSPQALEAAFRGAWPRIREGFILEVAGERLVPEIITVLIPPVGDVELPRDSFLTIGAALPEGDAGVRVGLTAGFGTFVPRQVGGGEGAYEGFLNGGELTPELPRGGASTDGAVVLRYVGAGFQQIVPMGFGHILFVLGMVFYAAQGRPLLWQGTAFTLSASTTLALAATGIVAIPADITSPLMAASLVYVGLENVLGHGYLRLRAASVGVFGLAHGLGFANGLADYGLPSGRLAEALIGFNTGVVFGLIAVIAVAFALIGWLRDRDWYRPYIAIPASLVVAAIGAFWLVDGTLL